MKKRLIGFIKQPLSLNIIINTLGSYLGVGFSFLYYLIFARVLDRIEVGVLGVILSLIYVSTNVLDLGTTQAIYAYLPKLIESKTKDLYSFVKTVTTYQLVVGGLFTFILGLFLPTINTYVLKTTITPSTVILICFSIMLFVSQNILQNMLIASKKVVYMNILVNISNALRVALLILLALTGNVSIFTILMAIGIAGPLLFIIPVLFRYRRTGVYVLGSSLSWKSLNLSYTITNLLSSQLFNFALRVDIFVLSSLALKDVLGTYTLSQKIVLSIMTAYIGITQVMSPEFSLVKNKRQLVHAFKTSSLFMLLPVAVYLLILLVPNSLFTLAFTQKFADTAPVTKSLAIPYILDSVINILLLFILYTVKKPIIVLLANIVFLGLMIIGCTVLIPTYGVYGAPIALSISNIVVISILVLYSRYEYRKLPV